ncbi:Membrane dipeptidase [Paenibacillus algicola]|uniref:Membrane dipeptidase n=1 Tax=Paenibacillus algicola TaxID=2565926 RepID=A0A4P8XLF7_9BACL|nr:dipeptidase [Paenibacillus algicola]QCT03135.1 Membrane dipeptidase [Paenibacillus algicola]
MTKVVDFHCDALSKLWEKPGLAFLDAKELDVSFKTMEQGDVALQVFAVFLAERFGRPSFERVLAQLDIFRNKLAAGPLEWLKWKEQIAEIRSGRQRFGMLSLEGLDGLEGNLFYVQLCYELGVRFMGLTWNHANWAADGVMEPRGGGLTRKGQEFVELCQQLGILLDVSHLSPAGFWELAEMSRRPLIASHSNCMSVCSHPRNLSNEQIQALIAMDGLIGLTFVPWFIRNEAKVVTPEDLLPHIEHVCSLGGAKHLMFGSDFDGIDEWVNGLENASRYPEFINVLLRHYPEELVNDFISGNALTFLEKHLPSQNG